MHNKAEAQLGGPQGPGSAVADDVLERLKREPGPALCWACEEWGCRNEDGQALPLLCACEEDICSCLEKSDNVCRCACHEWWATVRDAADSIERLQMERDELLGIVKCLADNGKCHTIETAFGVCDHAVCEWHEAEHAWESFCMRRGL